MEEGGNVFDETVREADLLEQMRLLCHPGIEKKSFVSWFRRARVTIRRIHRILRHLSQEALVQIQFAVRAPQNDIDIVKTIRCHGCDNTKPNPQTHKVSQPRSKTFSHEMGVNVFEIESKTLGSPSSHSCRREFVHG